MVEDMGYRRNGGGGRGVPPRLPLELAHSVVEQARTDLDAAGAMLALGTMDIGLDIVATTGFDAVDVDPWRHIDPDASVPPSECLRTGSPVSCETPAERAVRYPVLVGSQAWTDATACVPIRRGDEVAGVLAIAFRGSRSLDVAQWDRLAELAEVCGRQLAAEAGSEDVYGPPPDLAALDQAERLAVLARLGVEDGDAGALVDWLTGLAARLLGTEYAQVTLVGTEQVVASAAGFTVAEDVRRTPLSDALCSVCVAHRAPLVIEDATSHPWVRDLPSVRFGGVRRYLGAPLVVPGGTPIGALCVYDRNAGAWPADAVATLTDLATAAVTMIELRSRTRELAHRVDAQDLAYAQALSQLTAQAAAAAAPPDPREREAARDLQVRLLPAHPGRLPGAAVALCYRPADDLVGGDWHDVFALPGDRVGIVVGDVVGNHLRATLTMGALQAVTRSAAPTTGPAGVLERLDTAATSLGDRTGATVGYAEYDPATARLRYSCAAHLPPLVVADGRSSYLWGARGIPIGVRPIRRAEAEADIPPGAMLLWCTDGLVARRGERLHAGLERLAGVAAGLRVTDPEEFCAEVLAALVDGRPLDDDVVIVCLRLG